MRYILTVYEHGMVYADLHHLKFCRIEPFFEITHPILLDTIELFVFVLLEASFNHGYNLALIQHLIFANVFLYIPYI